MFRPLTRIKQKLDENECIELLKNERRGVLSVIGDNGYPYGMPLNHYYNDEDGKIYFHSGKVGHRNDALKSNDKVSYCVYDKGAEIKGDWALSVKSVIVFGRVEFVTNVDKIYDICAKLSRKFTLDEEYIKDEIKKYGKETLMFCIVPEYMTGKRVKEK